MNTNYINDKVYLWWALLAEYQAIQSFLLLPWKFFRIEKHLALLLRWPRSKTTCSGQWDVSRIPLGGFWERICLSAKGSRAWGELSGSVSSVFLPWRLLCEKIMVGRATATLIEIMRQKVKGQNITIFEMLEDRKKIRRLEGRTGKKPTSLVTLFSYLTKFGNTYVRFHHMWNDCIRLCQWLNANPIHCNVFLTHSQARVWLVTADI